MRSVFAAAALALSALTVTAAVASPASGESAAAFTDIGYDELRKLVDAKQVTLLDANGSTSFAEGHIPGAVDFRAAGDGLAAALPADKAALIVAYCGGPTCGAWQSAATAAQSLGYTNIRHFSAGIKGWKEKKGPLAM